MELVQLACVSVFLFSQFFRANLWNGCCGDSLKYVAYYTQTTSCCPGWSHNGNQNCTTALFNLTTTESKNNSDTTFNLPQTTFQTTSVNIYFKPAETENMKVESSTSNGISDAYDKPVNKGSASCNKQKQKD